VIICSMKTVLFEFRTIELGRCIEPGFDDEVMTVDNVVPFVVRHGIAYQSSNNTNGNSVGGLRIDLFLE
jgi:hypothetical protein